MKGRTILNLPCNMGWMISSCKSWSSMITIIHLIEYLMDALTLAYLERGTKEKRVAAARQSRWLGTGLWINMSIKTKGMLYATNTCQYHVLSYSTLVYVLCLHLKSVKRKEMAPYRYHHPWNKTCCCNTCQKWADKQILSHIPLAEEQGEEGVKQWKRLDSCLPTTYVSSTSSAPLAFRSTWHWHTRLVFHQWQHVPDSNATLLPRFHSQQATSNAHSPWQASWRQGTGSSCWSVWWSFGVILQHVDKNKKQLHSFCNNHDMLWSSWQPFHAPIHASLSKQHTDRRFVLWCTKMSPKTRRDAYIG